MFILFFLCFFSCDVFSQFFSSTIAPVEPVRTCLPTQISQIIDRFPVTYGFRLQNLDINNYEIYFSNISAFTPLVNVDNARSFFPLKLQNNGLYGFHINLLENNGELELCYFNLENRYTSKLKIKKSKISNLCFVSAKTL